MGSEMWTMPRIAREFGVALNTVQSSWRNATIRAVEEHVVAGGLPSSALEFPVKHLTAEGWRTVRRELGLKPLALPDAALPLPDVVLGDKPGWKATTIEAWADRTKRRDAQGRLSKAAPPGRPAGIVETVPRRRAEV